MRVCYRLEDLPHGCPRPVATIGNFDGVHLGHQQLMRELNRRAKKLAGTSAVVTFHPHPLQVLAPNNAPRQIQTLEQKLATIESLGIELVLVIPFDRQLAQTRAREFAVNILWNGMGLTEIYVGPNFAFGHRREGSFNLLKEIGEEKGFLVGKMPQVQFRGSRVSSTAVRQALLAGQVSLARRLLGRPHLLQGIVVHGTATGTDIRVPTANLQSVNELIPRPGVYVTLLTVDGSRYRGVTNIGVRPTLSTPGDEPRLSIETHLLDFQQELYDKEITLEFLVRLRDERKFPAVKNLVAQIQKDIGNARRYFSWLERMKAKLLTQKPGVPD